MGTILVGTASWADKSLLDSKLSYPKEANTAEARLRFYATHFSLVEVDSSYYALPAPQAADLWAKRTPSSFVFDLKAFRLFTQHHPRLAAIGCRGFSPTRSCCPRSAAVLRPGWPPPSP